MSQNDAHKYIGTARIAPLQDRLLPHMSRNILRAGIASMTALALALAGCDDADTPPAATVEPTLVPGLSVKAAASGAGEPGVDAPPPTVPSGVVRAPRTASGPGPVVSGLVRKHQPAPELHGAGEWLNSDPFTLVERRGSVVLVDFWTYSCVNCLRTLPYLRSWHEKYAASGLVVLGVHSPEFEFEKRLENLSAAVEELSIEYPVVQDNDFTIWRAFDNQFWPAKYLIDGRGTVRYLRHGEGAYEETEDRIRELLAEAGFDVAGIPAHTEPPPVIDPGIRLIRETGAALTRELYAGFRRNQSAVEDFRRPWVLHTEFYERPGSEVLYSDPGAHENGYLYLEGLWRNEPESLVHARETADHTDYVGLKFFGTSANAVMAPGPAGTVRVLVTMDGAPVPREAAGADLLFDSGGDSYVLVDASRMYRLVETPEYGGRELRLSTTAAGLEVYTFTFGSYEKGP